MATGATMEAALHATRRAGPRRLVLAVPVAPPDTIERLRSEVDEVVCLMMPAYLGAIGSFHRDFHQLDDAEVIRLLEDYRLVTLTGSGGTGKTRLSQRAAEEVFERFPDGAWLVELAPLADPEKIPQLIAATLGLHDSRSRGHLRWIAAEDLNRDRPLLLGIFGVFERAIDAAHEPLRADHLGDDQPAAAAPLDQAAKGGIGHPRHRRERKGGSEIDGADFHTW